MFSSIRIKLTLWYICVFAVTLTVLGAVAYIQIVNALERETDKSLADIAKSIAESARGDQGEESGRQPDAIVKEELEEMRFHDYVFSVYAADGRFVATTGENETPLLFASVENEDGFGTVPLNGKEFRVFVQPFRTGHDDYQLYALHSLTGQRALEARLRSMFYLSFPLVLLLSGISGYFLARQTLEPISVMAVRAKTISAANLHERLPVLNPKDELGKLALSFNELLDRLDIEFGRQRRFMTDASHELRTPLAIIRGESEVALLDANRDAAEYNRSLHIVQDESIRLTKIVEDLFTLSRADSGELKPDLCTVYLDEIVSDCVRAVRTLADKRNIRLKFRGTETSVLGDEALLKRLFLNLLDNSVKYNHESGTVDVTVVDGKVTIANSGEQIPELERTSIFDRFYRVEKARTKSTETLMSGAGLGLSISKWIAEIHDARLQYHRGSNDMNVFSVEFSQSAKH